MSIFLVVQLAFAQALAEQLAGVAVLACRLVAEAHGGTRGRQQGIEDALFGGVLGAILTFWISCSRSIFTAASARSRMIDSTSRPT